MKLAVKSNEYSTNVETHGNFRVANNAAMQKILSDSLYQDKIKSVIREISCNALDAHMECGVTENFKVTLPTNLEPVFSVRDFGRGLSLEQLEDLYTVYGISTKRNDNNAVGAFGLGSKSPFSYTKDWTVISRHNGMKYIVCNSINAHGSFSYNVLLAEECFDEEEGLEVRFDVNKGDVNEFKTKAEEVFAWFDKAPDCNIPLNIKKVKYQDVGPDYKISSYTKEYHKKNHVVVGPVAYPIESEHFKGNAATILDNLMIDIYVNIGDVSINPGRESLGYDKHTIDTIATILNRVYDQIKDKADKEVANCKSLWEARLFAKKYFNSGNYVGRILNYTLVYDGKKVTNNTCVTPNVMTNGISSRLEVYRYKWESYESKVVESKTRVDFIVSENVKIALYEQGGYAAAKRFVEQNQSTILYVVKDDALDFVKNVLGYPESEILKTASFPAAVKQARGKSVGKVVQAYRFDHNNKYSYHNSYAKNFWDAGAINLDNEKGYYALIKDFHINERVHGRELQEHAVGLNLIGVLVSRKDKVEAHANWTNIAEVIKKKLDDMLKDANILKYSDVSLSSDTLNGLVPIYNNLLRKDTKLAKALENIKDYSSSKKDVEEFGRLRSLYERISGQSYVVKTVPINLDIELTQYPLLKYINRYHFTEQEVINYINQIDKEL